MAWVLGGWSSDVQRMVWVPGGWSSDVQEMVWVLGGWSSDVQRLVQLAVGWPPIVKLWYQGSGAGPLMFNEWRRCLGKVLPKTIKIASPKSAKFGTHFFIEIRKRECAKTHIKILFRWSSDCQSEV
jgi:hypothetical protein